MIDDLIRRARRRYCLNEALAQIVFVAAVCVAGIILLLIVGTRYFGWWTVAVPATAGTALGIFRFRRRTPDSYATAIRVDRNANLHDALSTALYFSGKPEGAEAFRRSQREQAETLAGAVMLDREVPFIFPRAVFAVAALGLLASGLVALRTQLGLGLNLGSPITQAVFQDRAVGHPKQELERSDPKQWMQEAQALLARFGAETGDGKLSPEDREGIDKAKEQALQANASEKQRTGGTKSADESKESTGPGDPIELADPEPNGDSSSPSQGSGRNMATPSRRESLLSELKQAVAKLLPKSNLKENSPAESDEMPHRQQGEAKVTGDDSNSGKDKQMPGDSMSAALDGKPNSQSQSGQKGQLTTNEEQKGQGSGIGTQDGLKEQREAEQLKAMGKIAEIMGKRSASVSGEMTVEVQSGKGQQLRTAYTNTAASHREADGDVTRDKIPLALQPYVRQYFEEVRRAAISPPAGSVGAAVKTPVAKPCVESTILIVCP
jgi:hypothetical protein